MSNIDQINAANTNAYPVAAKTAGSAQQPSSDFSSALAQAMKDGAVQMSITAAGSGMTGAAGAGMQGGYMTGGSLSQGNAMQGQGIESMILAAAATGEVSDAQVALYMLCTMMQSNQNSEFSMLMQMMASMLTQIEDDKAKLRSDLMATTEYDPYVLDTIDTEVFQTKLPTISETGETILPVEAWRPTTPALTSDGTNRSPDVYRAVIDQFDVENEERYRPGRNNATYCNIYVWDVTSAMGAEIPHYTDPETGEPRYYPDTKGSKSMGAIATDEWLATHGEKYGWREADAETAQAHANEGKPAVTTAGKIGHVQVICPSEDGGYDPIRGVTVAQAGSTVTGYTHISGIYGTKALNNDVRYWIHD